MRKGLITVLANGIAFYLACLLFPSIQAESWLTFLAAGLILGLVNLFIRPILLLLALPLNLLTLGIFTLVINTWMVMLTSFLMPGLDVPGFWTALATSIVVTLANGFLKGLYKK